MLDAGFVPVYDTQQFTLYDVCFMYVSYGDLIVACTG